jgi:hypothetical protein
VKTLLGWTLAAVVALSGVSAAQSADKKDAGAGSAREKLIGAWRLVWLEEQGADGKVNRITDAEGSLIYA